ncbi:MAG: chemotaxis protein CheW [Bdellovibrionales bacterium]
MSESNLAEQYCTFHLGEDYYGISVLEVQEVIKPMQLTKIPLSSPMIKGLMNLRGLIVTSISLRDMFDLGSTEDQDYMNVIIRDNEELVALEVDIIDDVLNLNDESFEEAPDTLGSKIKPFVKGVHKLEGKLLVVLELDKILKHEGFELVAS